MAPVRILDVSRVPLTHHPKLSPPGDTVRLSFFDAACICIPPIQRLFLYLETTLPFPSLVESLKSSLSATLLQFYPLSGKLAYLPGSTADVAVDCSAAALDDGVAFTVAETEVDISRLEGDQVHDMKVFLHLVPELSSRVLPAPVFAVQVTKFVSGGVAIGFAAHHAVVDGRGLWQFVEAWTRACRDHGSSTAAGELRVPCHDRAVIRHPRAEEITSKFLRQLLPALPLAAGRASLIERRHELMRRTFVIGPTSIKSLKERAANQNDDDHSAQPSTFVALSAHTWISFLQAKDVKDDEATVLCFPFDCRTRLNPSIDEGFTGNCVRSCMVVAKAYELLSKNGLGNACRIIKSVIDDCLHEPLRNCEDWVNNYGKHKQSTMVFIASSPTFKVYETDFGWGKPSRVELVSINNDGVAVFVGGKEEGSVQTTVALSPLQMVTFASSFMDLSGSKMLCSN